MADYVLSNKADADLDDIYVFSYRTFGEAEADAYFLGLSDCLRMLAENPRLGRPVDDIQPGLLRHDHGHHIVFYMIEGGGIFVVRILHHAMNVERHVDPAKKNEP
ncbi:MAG: type II toxin-antitoxin system RelE/ParE family toxin [Rhodospirillales bacterium]|nr:type II toxin-antitoxin system RelE/ParE family toxin [Rhodospirillales bacterium]